MKKYFPIGIDDFRKLRKKNYYYVDKSLLIDDLLSEMPPEVTLYTRPRRFGKSLNMSMLGYFLDIEAAEQNRSLFEGLQIMANTSLCQEWMGTHPVLLLRLKNVSGSTYQTARDRLTTAIGDLAMQYPFLSDSPRLGAVERQFYAQLTRPGQTPQEGRYAMSDEVLTSSLQTLSALLAKHYGKETIILIDEYDVPLDKAYVHGYYDQMVELVRGMFNAALKSNDHLEFAVLTGCLRVSKESIFTGLNNLYVDSVSSFGSGEYFGFSEAETQSLFSYYGLQDHLQEAQEWYDGYSFGNIRIYCPWDVMSFGSELYRKKTTSPRDYWANSSGNDLVREFIDMADADTRSDLETLVNGGTVTKKLNENLTYRDLRSTVENLWNVLYATGYLTGETAGEKKVVLRIPNKEVQDIFETQISEWFMKCVREDRNAAEKIYQALLQGGAETAGTVLTALLQRSISIRDIYTRKSLRENFYHGFVMGLLHTFPSVRSNTESGRGYADILIQDERTQTGVVLELKYAENGHLEQACEEALEQIEEKQYDSSLRQANMKTIRRYGLAFFQKICLVREGRISSRVEEDAKIH